ncbi:MAG TPA: ABC transporter permease [Cyclobacteriaceae bacterium]|nr:ABC transporter permease [Cyclobacteriaceae bacterium]
MLKNYILASVRSLRKHFSYSTINIVGIGLGLATCMLLYLWIDHELSYDRFHANGNRIYRAGLEYSFGGQVAKTSLSPTALLPVMKKNFADVENGVRVYNPSTRNPYIVKNGEKIFQEKKFYFADSSFFEVFSFHLLQGNPAKALVEPNSIVLTQSVARKYFDGEDIVGKTLTINNTTEYKITGVVENCPSNSMIQFDFVASMSSREESKSQIWWSANYQTYLLLNANTDIDQLQRKTNDIVKKALATELTNPGDYVVYNLTPFTDIYLRSSTDEPEVVGSIQYVYVFSAIALLVLVIACINYVNLATAKAADRAKEVGIRKVAGAVRSQLFIQFISESLMVTFSGICIAFLLSTLALPLFNSLTGKNFLVAELFSPKFLSLSLVVWVVIALLAGAYPAVAITSFKPISVIKGNFKNSGKGLWLRQTLVVFQFCVSIVLMIGTTVILKQVDYIQNKKLGYNKDNVIVIPLDKKSRELYQQLKTEFERDGVVASMGRANESPTKINGGYSVKSKGSSGRGIIVRAMPIDKDFVSTMNMNLLAGRNFTDADVARALKDTVSALIVNQSTVKELGLTVENAVGTTVDFQGNEAVITAVVEDFHFSSLHEKIGPLLMFIATEDWELPNTFVRLNSKDVASSLNQLKSIGSSILSHRPFEYEFLDQKYQKLYDKEQRMGKVTTVFAGLAIAIACLGLFGLVAFAASQRTKEIGIRKVLGATSFKIVALITKNYMKLVVTAIAFGIPAAWWIMENFWLGGFAYRVSVGAGPLVMSSIACIAIAFATASFQAIKAALVNPSKTLRNE